MKVVDLVVETRNPAALDRTVQSFGAAVCQDAQGHYLRREGGCLVRCFGNADFVEFAIKNQGYGTVLKRLDVADGQEG